jgi:hypothetical protein
MAQKNNVGMLKVVLVIYAIVCIVYGVGFLFVPGIWVRLSESGSVDYGWLRWPGGILIALAIGALMAVRNPEKQGTFVFSIALATLLAGLGMLYSLIRTEYSGTVMFITVPTVLTLLLSGFLWWGRNRAKDIM